MRFLLIGIAAAAGGLMLGSYAGAQELRQICPSAAESLLASAELVSMPPGVILQSGEMTITQKDLDAQIRTLPEELWPQLKRNLLFVLENKLVREVIPWEAEAWAEKSEKSFADEESLVKAYFDSLTGGVSVTEKEIKDFFDQNQDIFGGAAFDQAKDQIRQYLLNKKRDDIVVAQIKGVGSRYQLRLSKDWAARQCRAAADNPVDKARSSGKPTLVDFGADGCRPCEMMAPILDEIKKEYEGRLNVVFVHVRKEQILAERYGVQSIPVQVFYNKDGQEVFRHVGFYSKEQITSKLTEMGVK